MLGSTPAKGTQVVAQPNDPRLRGADSLRATSLLVCDDTVNVREFLRLEVSQHADLDVVGEAANGLEAIEQARRLQPDVTLLDIRMPVLDGLDALPRILEAAPGTKVVAFSGLEADEVEALALARGAVAFVPKGQALASVITAIRQVGSSGPKSSAAPLPRQNEQPASAPDRDALASIVDYAFDAIIAVDLEGIVTSWNAAAEAMYGYAADEMLGRNISVVLTDRDECLELLARARMGEVSRYETTRLTKSGRTIEVWMTASPLRDADGNVIGSSNITMDISDRKRAGREADSLRSELEARVRQRTEQLEARTEELQESMRELDAFAYTVSHDLRAPLRAMDGFSRILLDEYMGELDPDAARYLGFIRTNAQGMQELVDGLLAFSRLGRRALKRLHLSPGVLARQALSDLGTLTDRADLKVEIDEDLPSCWADHTLLKQVFVNLIGNSIKFSKGTPEARIRVGSHSEAGETVYFVKDNGVGFEPEYADKVFGVFQRLHRAEDFEGTGIGLANVLRIVTKHEGRVWCESKPGEGATFFFTIGSEGKP